MNFIARKLENVNRYGLFVPSLAMAIFIYYFLAYIFLTQVNSAAPRALPDAFYFTQLVYFPKPFDVFGYFLGFLIVPVLALGIAYVLNVLVERKIISQNQANHWPFYLGAGLLLFVLYRMVFHVFWFDQWQKSSPKGDLKHQVFLAFSLGIALWLYLRKFDIAKWVDKFESLNWNKLRVLFFAAIIIFIFSPNFPIDHYHYNYFLGPANDLLHGKQFLNDTTSHYGFLVTYFLYGFFKIVPISYQALSFLLALIFIFWHIAWYYLIRKWLKSETLAAVGVLAMAVFLAIPGFDFDIIYGAPSNTPFHQLSFLLLAWVWLKYGLKRNARKLNENLLAIATALGFYWFVDNGIYIAIASPTVFLFWDMFEIRPFSQALKAFARQAAKIFGCILAFAIAYSVFKYWDHGYWPNWKILYEPVVVYSQGYMLRPLPPYGVYWVYIFVLMFSLVYILWQRRRESESERFLLPLLLTIFGIFQLTYYINRPHPLDLSPRHSFFLILLALWWSQEIRIKYMTRENIYYAFSCLFLGAVVFMSIYGITKFAYTVWKRDYLNVVKNYTSEWVGRSDVYGGNADILKDIAVLKSEYGFLDRPALMHWYDTKILLDLGKTNFFPIFDFTAIFFRREMDEIIKKAQEDRPSYLFVGRKDSAGFEPFSVYTDKLDYFSERVSSLYTLDRRLETMDVLRLK